MGGKPVRDRFVVAVLVSSTALWHVWMEAGAVCAFCPVSKAFHDTRLLCNPGCVPESATSQSVHGRRNIFPAILVQINCSVMLIVYVYLTTLLFFSQAVCCFFCSVFFFFLLQFVQTLISDQSFCFTPQDWKSSKSHFTAL